MGCGWMLWAGGFAALGAEARCACPVHTGTAAHTPHPCTCAQCEIRVLHTLRSSIPQEGGCGAVQGTPAHLNRQSCRSMLGWAGLHEALGACTHPFTGHTRCMPPTHPFTSLRD